MTKIPDSSLTALLVIRKEEEEDLEQVSKAIIMEYAAVTEEEVEPECKPANSLTRVDVLEFFACSKCKSTIMDVPVYRCDNDHLLCQKCNAIVMKEDGVFEDGPTCPACPAIMDNQRSKLAEKILKKTFPATKCSKCIYAKIDESKVAEHEKHYCRHRPVQCYECDETIQLSGLPRHALNVHKEKCRKIKINLSPRFWINLGKKDNATIPMSTWHPNRRYGEKVVYFFLNRVTMDENYLIWISTDEYMPPREEGRGDPGGDLSEPPFTYKITLLVDDKAKPFKKIASYSGSCSPHLLSAEDMKKKMMCMVIPRQVAQESCHTDGKSLFRINIQRSAQRWSLQQLQWS